MKAYVNGIDIAYELAGQGVRIVLVHGFPLSRRMWRHQIPALAGRSQVLALDLRGHGESEAPAGPYSIDLFADDVAALIRHLGLGPAIIAGHSMGGYIAFRLYARHRQLVGGLILANTRAEADTEEGRRRRHATIERIRREGPSGFFDDMAEALLSPATREDRPELMREVRQILEATPTHSIIASLQALADRQDNTPLLPEIKVPTLIIAGEQDQIISAEAAKRLHAGIADSKYVVIEKTGHLSSLESPEAFNRAIIDFLTALA